MEGWNQKVILEFLEFSKKMYIFEDIVIKLLFKASIYSCFSVCVWVMNPAIPPTAVPANVINAAVISVLGLLNPIYVAAKIVTIALLLNPI